MSKICYLCKKPISNENELREAYLSFLDSKYPKKAVTIHKECLERELRG